MTSSAFQSFRRKVIVEWPKKQDEDAKKLLLKVSSAGHADIMQKQTSRSGIAPDWNAYANRPGNEDLNSVVIPGPIVYKYRYLREVVEVALNSLRKWSPVDSGDYVSSHQLYVNGQAVAVLPVRLGPEDLIMISNPVPYARRIEVGKTKSGRSFVLQVPPHIYERVTKQILIPNFRNVAKIEFDYASLSGAYVKTGGMARRTPRYATGNRAGPRGGGTLRKRRPGAGEAVRAPAIFIQALS